MTVAIILIAVVACDASGGTLASSPADGTSPVATESAADETLPSPEGIPEESCVPHTVYSDVAGGTRVDDLEHGFALTLPPGWAQIDLASGELVPAFSGLTIEPDTEAFIKAIGPSAKTNGYEWLAVDLGPRTGGSPVPPSDLLVDLSSANGATLDSIAARLTVDLRGNGVTGEIEQVPLTLAGGDAIGLRFVDVTQGPDGVPITAVESYYIALRGDTQISLAFTVAAENNAGSTAIFNAIAQSLEFPLASCPGALRQSRNGPQPWGNDSIG